MMFPGANMPTRTAGQRRAKQRAFEAWVACENERVRRQRVYLSVLQGAMRVGVVGRMLDRAWALLDAGEGEAADALLEFVPEAEAEALLREFFDEPTSAQSVTGFFATLTPDQLAATLAYTGDDGSV